MCRIQRQFLGARALRRMPNFQSDIVAPVIQQSRPGREPRQTQEQGDGQLHHPPKVRAPCQYHQRGVEEGGPQDDEVPPTQARDQADPLDGIQGGQNVAFQGQHGDDGRKAGDEDYFRGQSRALPEPSTQNVTNEVDRAQNAQQGQRSLFIDRIDHLNVERRRLETAAGDVVEQDESVFPEPGCQDECQGQAKQARLLGQRQA